MILDRPGDGDALPPDEPRHHRDVQRSGELAETRSRQEYWVDQQITTAMQSSAAEQQATAEEQAAAEKWDRDSSQSRGIWSEYQCKWPQEEEPPVDRSGDPPGTWYGDRDRRLEPADDNQVEAACDRIAKREEDKISPRMRAVEGQDPNRHLIGFDRRLKDRDRVKEKVCDFKNEKGHSLEKAVTLVPDAIRYTFQYPESRYSKGVWADIERLKGQGFELYKVRNFWSDEEYKGINSQWIDSQTGQRFEVQFHTHISFEAKQLTHDAYERIRALPEDEFEKKAEFEKMVLKAFQRKVSADIPVPPGAYGIPDYP